MNVFDSGGVFRSNSSDLTSFMNRKTILKQTMLGLATLALTFTALAEEHKSGTVDLSKLPPASSKAGVTYANDIKPIFEASCIKCHGAEKPKAGLRLTSLEGALKGTKEGKVISPGNSTKSSLVISVACISSDDEEWMPPKNNKAKIAPLTKDEVSLIRAWVDQGAK